MAGSMEPCAADPALSLLNPAKPGAIAENLNYAPRKGN
jgi:hypothetical protein